MKLKILNKFLSVLITTLLVIQPLSGSITTFQNIAYSAQNKDLEKVKNIAFEYIGHNLYSENSQFPQIQEYIPKTLVHSIIGGTLSELAGGDFSQGAIATAVSHNVAEFIEKTLLNKAIMGELSNEQAKEIIKGVSSVVSGAVVLATHENVTQKELDISQDMGESVVVNNALKNFDDKVEFGKGLLEVVGTELLDILELVINNPNEVLENLSDLITALENFDINDLDIEGYIKDSLTPEIADELIAKLNNIDNAISNNDIEYKGKEANQAGKDLGEVIATLSGLVGAKGLSKALKYGAVTTRINISNKGMEHVSSGHFNKDIANTRSVFSISQDELKNILQNKNVIKSPVTKLDDNSFIRVVDIGKTIGTTSIKEGGTSTSKIKIITDKAGNLITAYPVK